MPSTKHLIATVIFFYSIHTCCYAQTNTSFLQQTVTALNKRSASLPVEKAYIQTDKPIYATGDTIWFKGYVTIGVLHRLSTKSGILHLQLVNANNKVCDYTKLPLNNGICSGSIILPDSLEEGAYQLRAYTNWMRNFGEDYFFKKDIYIGNVITNDVHVKASFSHLAKSGLLSANIRYADLNGNGYANKQVVYNVIYHNKTIYRGKGQTDDKGLLKIQYQRADSSVYDGLIHTELLLGKKNIIKDIRIGNSIPASSIQFFPEGGYLVNGLPSTVAFKCIGTDGLGKDVNGAIVDNENHEEAQFSSTHLGMGSFTFTPQSGKNYTAVINTVSGDRLLFPLPKPHENGYVMNVDNHDTARLAIKIIGTPTQVPEVLSLVAQSLGIVCYATQIKITAGEPVLIKLSNSHFPSGITQLTLFSSAGEPVSERIAFIRKINDRLNLQLTPDKETYLPEQQTQITLKASSLADNPVVASLSATVINDSDLKSAEIGEPHILSALLLTSALKGNIEQPDYYFDAVTEKTNADLDLLMLTQGYRTIDWKRLDDSSSPVTVFKEERNLTINGALKTPDGKPIPFGKVHLFTTVGEPITLDTIADDKGLFVFNDLRFNDSTRVILQATNAKNGSNVIIETQDADSNASIQLSNNSIIAVDDTMGIRYLQKSKKLYDQDIKYGIRKDTRLLKEVTIKEVAKPELHSSNLNGPGHHTQIITGDQLTSCMDLASCLIGRLRGVVIDVKGKPHAPRNRIGFKGDDVMSIILDGVFVNSFDIVNPMDISSVELLMDPADLAIYGVAGSKGIILINTKRGDEIPDNFFRATNVLSYMPKGYAINRHFYVPAYPVPYNPKKPDLRTTVYWNRNLTTDENGNASLKYINAGKGSYRVLVEGIDNDGNLGYVVYRYEIK